MLKLEPRPSEASIKLYERSEFRVAFAFSQIHEGINQKLPLNRAKARFNRV
jgi:hypothetical protein